MKEIQLKQLIKEILDEMIVNQPGVKIKPSNNLPVLDLKIGKYDVSKGRRGRSVPFNSKNISSRTRNRVNKIFDTLGIKPEKTYVAWMVDDKGTIRSLLKSTFVVSSYKGEPIIVAQTQTEHPMAGQLYLYSKYFKSDKGIGLEGATKEEILKILKYDNL
jgi:hypothetical protein